MVIYFVYLPRGRTSSAIWIRPRRSDSPSSRRTAGNHPRTQRYLARQLMDSNKVVVRLQPLSNLHTAHEAKDYSHTFNTFVIYIA